MATAKATARLADLTAAQITDLTVAVNEISDNDSQVNAYQIRNALLLARKKARVR